MTQKINTCQGKGYDLINISIKKSKWMTNGILKSIKTKDTLYKKLVKANIDDKIVYTNLKAEFTDYKKILRRSINEAKHSYYARTFALYKNDIKQTWSVIKDTLQRKKNNSGQLHNLFSTIVSSLI